MSFQTEAKDGGMQPHQLCRAPGEDWERERTERSGSINFGRFFRARSSSIYEIYSSVGMTLLLVQPSS
jgi:hypothetical protein